MPIALKTYRQLQPEDCMTVASLHQQCLGVRAIAHLLQRSPATVSRELRWSPEQIALTLASIYPKSHPYRTARNLLVLVSNSGLDPAARVTSRRL